MMQTFLAIAGDQRVVAGLAIFVGFNLGLFCYVIFQERKGKSIPDPNESDEWIR